MKLLILFLIIFVVVTVVDGEIFTHETYADSLANIHHTSHGSKIPEKQVYRYPRRSKYELSNEMSNYAHCIQKKWFNNWNQLIWTRKSKKIMKKKNFGIVGGFFIYQKSIKLKFFRVVDATVKSFDECKNFLDNLNNLERLKVEVYQKSLLFDKIECFDSKFCRQKANRKWVNSTNNWNGPGKNDWNARKTQKTIEKNC